MTHIQEAVAPDAAPIPSLGDGYDSVSGELRNTAITFKKKAGGARTQIYIRVCEGLIETSEALEINQSLSIDYLGIVKVDQKMEFLKKQKMTQQSLSIVVYSRHELGTSSVKDAKFALAPDAKRVVPFVKAYGDSYIDAISEGGEYYAVYTFYTETREQQQSLKLTLQTEGVASGVKVNAELETKLDKFIKTIKTDYRFDQQLSGIENPQMPVQDEIIEFAIGFPSTPLDSPVVIDISTAGYEKLPDFPLNFKPIVRNRRYFVGGGIVDGLTVPLVKIVSLQDTVDLVRRIYDRYGHGGEAGLGDFDDALAADFRAIKEQFLTYEDDPLQSFETPSLPSLDRGTPQIAYEKETTELWGGDWGEAYGFGSVNKAIEEGQRLTAIRFRTGDRIDRIELDYEDANGHTETRIQGGTGGKPRIELKLDPGEFPVRIDASVSVLWNPIGLMRLKITTNRGDSIEGGKTGDIDYEWHVPEDAVVLGFQSHANNMVVGFQAVYARLKPATFMKND